MNGMELLKNIFTNEAHDKDICVRLSKDAIDEICKQVDIHKMYNQKTIELVFSVESCEIGTKKIFLNLETGDDCPF